MQTIRWWQQRENLGKPALPDHCSSLPSKLTGSRYYCTKNRAWQEEKWRHPHVTGAAHLILLLLCFSSKEELTVLVAACFLLLAQRLNNVAKWEKAVQWSQSKDSGRNRSVCVCVGLSLALLFCSALPLPFNTNGRARGRHKEARMRQSQRANEYRASPAAPICYLRQLPSPDG